MLILVLRTAILMAAMLSGCLQAGTLDDIRALEAGKNGRIRLPAERGFRIRSMAWHRFSTAVRAMR